MGKYDEQIATWRAALVSADVSADLLFMTADDVERTSPEVFARRAEALRQCAR